MDIPNFKDILQKLSVFKNKSLLIPLVIGLVSILLFIPTQLMSSGLKKQVQEKSISNGYNRVKTLLQKAVSDELLEKKTQQLQTRANDANEIERLAQQTNKRQLLSYNIFDVNDPNDILGLTFLQFGQQFRGGIEKMIASANAGDCPTQAELTRAIEESGAKSRSRIGMGRSMNDARSTMPSRPQPMRNPGSRDFFGGPSMVSELERVVIDQLCQKRAQEISCYVTPAQLSGYEFWNGYDINVQKIDAVEDCWYYQLAYWVIEDVFDTIISMNSGYENTLSAPVKRLMRIGFSIDTSTTGMGRRSIRSRTTTGNTDLENDDRPKYVFSSDRETMLTEPCTGRYSDENEDIEVIHFNIVCVVSIKDFMSFMKELCSSKEHQYIDELGQTHTYKHNQITIIETNVESVDKEDFDHTNYHYGNSGVIKLDLICEYILKKDGYEYIKPESVKATLLGEE